MAIIGGSWIAGSKSAGSGQEISAISIPSNVSVDWKWFDKSNGIVSWNFKNNSYYQTSVILFRNGYYFGNAYWCFKPDEILLGDNKTISEYMPGDAVLGTNGLQRVVAVGRRYVEREEGLIRIEGPGLIPLDVTPDHPVLTVEEIDNGHRNDSQGAPTFTSAQFIPARKLKGKDYGKGGRNYLIITIPSGVYSDSYINFSLPSPSPGQDKVVSYSLDSASVMLLGAYVGFHPENEDGRGVWSIRVRDSTRAFKLKDAIEKLGFKSEVVRNQSVGDDFLVIVSTEVYKLLDKLGGSSTYGKKIPDVILYHENLSLLSAFMDGLMSSGCNRSHEPGDARKSSFATISKLLAMQLQLAWLRLGKYAKISIRNGDSSNLDGEEGAGVNEYVISVDDEPISVYWIGNSVYVPLLRTSKIDYEGYVYDVQTEENIVVASNIVTHNCIYVANRMTSWGTRLSPLRDVGVERNMMPIGIVDFGAGRRLIAFIFTLGPDQSWSALEGGFSASMPPSGINVYDVSFERTGPFCIGYDEQQVVDWDRQTRSNLPAYSPNPSTISTIEVSTSSLVPFVQLFQKDSISESQCEGSGSYPQEGGSAPEEGDLEEIIGNIVKIIRSI